MGIDKDPVTGSAYALLTPPWAARLGKRSVRAFQASACGGELWVSLRDDDRVDLTEQAVLVLEGQLNLPAS